MKILVTRPQLDASRLMQKLQVLGHEARAVPLLDIVANADAHIPAKTFAVCCLTSANGLTDSLDVTSILSTPIIAVGPQSARVAQARGFTRIYEADGDVAAVILTLKQHFAPASGPVLYLSGEIISSDLAGQLGAQGYDVTRLVTYAAQPLLPASLVEDVAWADWVMLYSPRSAKLWQSAIQALGARPDHLMHLCLSNNVAKALPVQWPQTIAAAPTEHAMLTALDRSGFPA